MVPKIFPFTKFNIKNVLGDFEMDPLGNPILEKDKNGNLIGHANKDINLNTIMYEVEFDDGQCAAYAANVIAQEIYSSVDAEGRKEAIIEEIIGFDRNSKYAVPKEKQFFYLKGKKHRRRTTAGWKLLTRCSDGSEQWVPLKDMKETYPVQVSHSKQFAPYKKNST